MRRVILFVLAAIVVVGVAWVLAGLPGTVTVSLSGYTVGVATSLAIAAVAAIVLALLVLIRLLGWIWHTPGRVGFWRARRRRVGGDEAVTRTLVAIAAGAGDAARQESARARKLLGDTPQTLLLAAEAGRLANREDEATELYRRLAERKDAALLGLRGLFRQAMNREAWSEAATIAERAEAAYPNGAWLREERAQLAARTGNWRQALRLAAPPEQRRAFAVAAANAESSPRDAERLARATWRLDKGFAPAALAYARRLREAGHEVKALQVIREAWAAEPNPDLAAFSMAGIEDRLARVREATRIVSYNADHPESQFLLAQLSLEAGLTGEARHHLARAREAGLQQRRAWLLLADIEERAHGDSEAGEAAQREALRHAATAEPDAGWICEVCGTDQGRWVPVCGHCHTPGKVGWGTRRMAPLALPA